MRQEAHGHCFYAARVHLPRDRFRLNGIQRSLNLACSQQPFLDFEGKMSRNQRFRTLEPDIVGIRPIASSNLVDVPRTFGDG